jgi:SAM-dependent methyltransferase
MDTPQLRARVLETPWDGADALLGLAEDGGFWAIGLRRGCPPTVFDGVPMSSERTGSAQLARLFDLGLHVRLLPPERDVDLPEDAEAVARAHPDLLFSRCWAELVRARPEQSGDRLFDSAYAGRTPVTSSSTGGDDLLVLDVDRWSAGADRVDEMVVSRCEPPVIDLGCGPGRMVEALTRSGRSALGVDMSQEAVRATRTRGGAALQRLLDEPLPGEGRWGTALLMDGNLGIGGDVAGLLQRCQELVGPGGLVVCEVDPHPSRDETGHVVLRSAETASAPLPWARVGAATLVRLAAPLDLVPHEEWVAGGRAFVALRNSRQLDGGPAFPA